MRFHVYGGILWELWNEHYESTHTVANSIVKDFTTGDSVSLAQFYDEYII